ncbi:MAG: S8 family serine peptidase, partial [Holophagales bacterium]|nr:S8 family serine peptidase [Holophagales bacterium]
CDVIVDDVLYLGEPVFQDGIVAQAVDQVAASGVAYFTSAGNSGNLNDSESGVWEGDYVATALPAVLAAVGLSAHDFGGGDSANGITEDGPAFFTLQWADPQDGSANDYDLYLLDAAMANVVAASTSTQNGTQDPLEAINTQAADDTGNHLVVVKVAGSDRFLHLNTHRGRLETGTDGQIFGHPGALGAMTLAAVDVSTAAGGKFTGGAANPVEFFSSDGPRRIFFDPSGAPLFAGNTLLGVPSSVVRQKPDFAAADGVSTATPGFDPFFGTSASAPHAAAIASLVKELHPRIKPEDIFDAFSTTALDIEALGFDRDSGFGIIDAETALGTPIFVDGFESGDATAWTK